MVSDTNASRAPFGTSRGMLRTRHAPCDLKARRTSPARAILHGVMTKQNARYVGVELGGTKTIAVLCAGTEIVERLSVPTTTPDGTLGAVQEKLIDWHRADAIDGLGLASFGPIRLIRDAPDYGTILSTPKAGWSGVRLLETLGQGLDCPIGIDTDVNAAGIAEYRWGAGQGCSSLVYLTIGTGIGGGVLIDGRPVHGRLHPEIGYLLIRRMPSDLSSGTCRFHGDCIEGLISGPALAERFGMPTKRVSPDEPQWNNVAHDLAQLLTAIIHTLAPQRILVGGGVGLGVAGLLRRATAHLPTLLGDYYPDLGPSELSAMVTAPLLGADAGPLGAIALAQEAAFGGSLARPFVSIAKQPLLRIEFASAHEASFPNLALTGRHSHFAIPRQAGGGRCRADGDRDFLV